MLNINTLHIAQHISTKPGKIEHLIGTSYQTKYYYYQDISHKSCIATVTIQLMCVNMLETS